MEEDKEKFDENLTRKVLLGYIFCEELEGCWVCSGQTNLLIPSWLVTNDPLQGLSFVAHPEPIQMLRLPPSWGKEVDINNALSNSLDQKGVQ